jgi:hypothetical protein
MTRTLAAVAYWFAAVTITLVIVGIVCFLYTKQDPFWLLVLTQGVLILGSTWVFTQGQATVERSDQQ